MPDGRGGGPRGGGWVVAGFAQDAGELHEFGALLLEAPLRRRVAVRARAAARDTPARGELRYLLAHETGQVSQHERERLEVAGLERFEVASPAGLCQALYQLGHAQLASGDLEQARSVLERGLVTGPAQYFSVPLLSALAETLAHLGEHDRACETAREATAVAEATG